MIIDLFSIDDLTLLKTLAEKELKKTIKDKEGLENYRISKWNGLLQKIERFQREKKKLKKRKKGDESI
jgi:hypothetical protein